MSLSFVSSVFAQDVNDGDPVPMARSRREKNVSLPADSIELDTLFINDDKIASKIDSIKNEPEYVEATAPDTAKNVNFYVNADSLAALALPAPKGRFIPDPKKAMWLAVVFPGGGQIYNRKYWKLPLIYGGFLGCVYAMTWNNTMYRDYSQAYIDIMDSDENTKSYENFLPPSYDVNANMERLKTLFQRKKNYYRRFRDLSMFCMIGVYALSIVDAYVDAEMSSFDISHDLSMKVKPTIINDRYSAMRASGMSPQSYGFQCSLSF
ncbi:MAG: hypothetical protein KBT33_08265 [Prevotellaceae bacterium]|nr:hypothetical protein [Candidatus Minthosoma equi]